MKGRTSITATLIIAVAYYSCSIKSQLEYENNNFDINSNAIQFREHPASCFHVQTDGILASRMSFNLDKLINSRQLHTKYAGWGADQIGRWIGAAILEATLLKRASSLPIIKKKVYELIEAQDKDGFYYGDELRKQPDRFRQSWSGQGRGLWSMLDYYNITKDANTLNSLLNAAKHTVEKRPEWQISKPLSAGIESAVGPIARLGLLTKNQDFIDWGKDIADHIQHEVAEPSAIPTAHVASTNLYTHEMKPLFHHTHTYLSTAHGIAELAVITNEKKYFDQAKKVFDDSFSSVWGNGVFPESYGDYYERIDETCSTVDWIYLALKLFSITGDVQYLDAVELSVLNGLFFEQNNIGGFDTYRSINRHYWGDLNNWGGEQTECCTMAGGWGLAQVAMYTITSNDQGISVNLPFQSQATFPNIEGSITADQKIITDKYELRQQIQIANKTNKKRNVRVRIPYWSTSPQFFVNDKLTDIDPQEGFIEISCEENSDIQITVIHPMELQEIPPRSNYLSIDTNGEVAGNATESGLQYGPYVMMYSRELFPYTEKHIEIDVLRDGDGKPIVSQYIPADWQKKGAVPLLLEADLNKQGKVYLFPAANLPMMKFTNPDPYILRFKRVALKGENENKAWLYLPRPMISFSDTSSAGDVRVHIESIFEDKDIYYTLDGSLPSKNSSRFSETFTLKKSTLISASTIDKNGTCGEVSKVYYRKIKEPIAASRVSNLKSGVKYAYFEKTLNYLPNYAALTPIKRGIVSNFSFKDIKVSPDGFALLFNGYIDILKEGIYTFYTSSDDGSKLRIDDWPIVQNDGTHGMVERYGEVYLMKGKHEIEVSYFESAFGEGLKVSYQGPEINKTEIPASVLFRKKD